MTTHSTEFLGPEYGWEWDSIWDSTVSLGYDYESKHRNSLIYYMSRRDTMAEKDTVTEQETLAEKKEEEPHYISGLKLAAVVGSITLVIFILLLDVSIISTAIPRITSDFHSLEDVGWYSAAYQLSSASLQPLTGKFYTNFSSKWTFLFFVFLFEVGSLICGTAYSSTMFIGGRAIAGMGGSGIINGGLTIISGAVPPEKRAFYTSMVMGFGQLGLITGPLIGGSLTEYTTWRWCFYLNLPIGAVAAGFLILVRIPELSSKPDFSFSLIRKVIPELDLIGFALFAPASVMLLIALQFGGNDYPWNSSVIIGLFCGAAITFIIFALWEYRVGDKAMIPGSIITQRLAMSSAVQGMFLLGTVFVASIYFPMYFQAVKGVSPTLSGVYLLPSIVTQLIVVVTSGWLITKLGYYTPWAIGAGILSALGNGLVSTFSPTTETARWVGYQILLGAGRGAGMQTAMIAIQNGLPGRQIPVAIAFQIFCQNLLGAVLLVIASVIFNQSLASEIAQHAPSVSPTAATAAGGSASGVRALLPVGSPELPGLLLAYSNSIDRIFYLLVACSLISFAASWGMGWKDTRKKNQPASGGH